MSPNQLVLCWKDHNGTLVSVFQNLLKNNTLVDCTLAAEGQYLKAHKVVLSACSSYFEVLFSQESEKNPIVILKDVEFQELEAVVNFMYRGEVEVCEDRLAAFLEVAESLQVKGLGCDGVTLFQKSKEKLSLLEKITSPKVFRKGALNCHNDSVGESANVPALQENEILRDNENFAVHQPFQSESSHSSPTLPLSSGQDTWNDEDNFANSRGSLTALPQFSSGENEQSDIKYDLKIEPSNDIGEEERSEEIEMDFQDDVAKMEDQEDWDEHNVETMNDDHSITQQDLGAECVVNPDGPNEQQPTRSRVQFQDTGTTSRLTNILDTTASPMQPQERSLPEAGKHISLQRKRTFSPNLKLRKHLQHSKSSQVHKCTYCDYTAVTKTALTRHLRSHTGERPYKCAYCAREFSLKGNLKTHIGIHTGDKPYQCSECDFRSNDGSGLAVHRRIHTGEKPYECSECDYKASQISNLRVHRRKHSGEKRYECSECNYKSSLISNLRKHRRIHSGEQTYQCSECNYKASQISNLRKHRRIHSGEKTYQCPERDYKASRISHLSMHR